MNNEPDEQQPENNAPPDPDQLALFDIEEDWRKEWQDMPEFEQEDLEPYYTVKVHFRNMEDVKQFEAKIGQRVATKKNQSGYMWYPEAIIGRTAGKRYACLSPFNPRYPVYIISKGRWESRLTSKALEKMCVPYHIVVEPQKYDQYAAVIAPEKIYVLPFSNLGQGSIPARNWVWEHSISIGAERHWILDDNISAFHRWNNNLKIPVTTGAVFKAAEDFIGRYENVAISGFNYFMFVYRKSIVKKAILLNTRIYSCILIKNDIPYRWRGRYNEDTDLSLRALKDGWCTVLFNAFLAFKQTTMTMAGGNTEGLYLVDDGRLKMAESLRDQHPDCVTITEKWGRPQHQVDYRRFKGNKLIRKPGIIIPEGVNNYGIVLMFKGQQPHSLPVE